MVKIDQCLYYNFDIKCKIIIFKERKELNMPLYNGSNLVNDVNVNTTTEGNALVSKNGIVYYDRELTDITPEE